MILEKKIFKFYFSPILYNATLPSIFVWFVATSFFGLFLWNVMNLSQDVKIVWFFLNFILWVFFSLMNYCHLTTMQVKSHKFLKIRLIIRCFFSQFTPFTIFLKWYWLLTYLNASLLRFKEWEHLFTWVLILNKTITICVPLCKHSMSPMVHCVIS